MVASYDNGRLLWQSASIYRGQVRMTFSYGSLWHRSSSHQSRASM